jgi:hypothetical protein
MASHLTGKLLIYEALLSRITGDPFPVYGLRHFQKLDGSTYRRTVPGLQAQIGTDRNPIFANVTITLTVATREWADPKKNKISITEQELLHLGQKEHLAYFFLENMKNLCGMMAPYIYEYDPRKGELLDTIQEDYLFDPPGFSPKTYKQDLCSICRDPHVPPEIWGGGNLGAVHLGCGRSWNVF